MQMSDNPESEMAHLMPFETGTRDELAQIAASFNSVQDVAVDLAGEQAIARRVVSQNLINVARRNQNLLGRTLGFISSLEEGERDLAALAHDLVLTVVDVDGVAAVAKAAKRQRRDKVKVHLKVDTGMRRVGCTPEEAPGLAQLIDDAKFLRLDGLYSHLPVSDVDAGREFTASQIELFARVVAAVEAARGPVPLKHLANSGGVLGHPESWLDMVRPGLMIYGHYPDPEAERTVEITPAMRLETKVLFVKRVKQGEAVGYGHTWTAPADTWIATLPVGYGDGYSRLLSNRGRVLIDGGSYPIVGRVCMDQTMIDLGPKTRVEVGDEAVLIGRSGDEEITVAEIAELMGTIPYEVTCLITGRVERTF